MTVPLSLSRTACSDSFMARISTAPEFAKSSVSSAVALGSTTYA